MLKISLCHYGACKNIAEYQWAKTQQKIISSRSSVIESALYVIYVGEGMIMLSKTDADKCGLPVNHFEGSYWVENHVRWSKSTFRRMKWVYYAMESIWREKHNTGILQGLSRMISGNGDGTSLKRANRHPGSFPTLEYGLSGNTNTITVPQGTGWLPQAASALLWAGWLAEFSCGHWYTEGWKL